MFELGATNSSTPKAVVDDKAVLHYLTEAPRSHGFVASHVASFPMRTVEDIAAYLEEQDIVSVFGSSVTGLVAMWHSRGVDGVLRLVWRPVRRWRESRPDQRAGTPGGTIDSFGEQLQSVPRTSFRVQRQRQRRRIVLPRC